MISAYNINRYGVLVYSGLATQSDELTFGHHNDEPYLFLSIRSGRVLDMTPRYHYEVISISQWGLVHSGIEGRKYKQ